MGFCAITATRGDRGKFLDHLAYQINRMTVKPEQWYIVDDKPESNAFDLTYRIKKGCKMAYEDGFNEVFVLEDDDQYAHDYFEYMTLGQYDFVGSDKTTYYNLSNRTWQTMEHKGRSSLFHTGFKLSALNGFKWPKDDYVFLDIPLWQHAKSAKFVDSKAIGIKHGWGLCGGSGHKMKMANLDGKLEWLSANVDKESFEFYKSIL
jgi:hypothetical protein